MGHGEITGDLLADVFIIDTIIQWTMFIHATVFKTERFFDLIGSGTFFSLAIYSLQYKRCVGVCLQVYVVPTIPALVSLTNFREYHLRQIIVSLMVCVWALRLGSYLFSRIQKDGKDSYVL